MKITKAKIHKVGTIENGGPVGWIFGGPSEWEVDLIDTHSYYGGWTVDELREVIRRPEEFVTELENEQL